MPELPTRGARLEASRTSSVFLTVRQELKRFQRKGLGYSKDLDTHKKAIALLFGFTISFAVITR